jgi:imidazolonepropionase-like amidohydrolase
VTFRPAAALALVIATLASAAPRGEQAARPRITAFVGARIIDGRTADAIERGTLVVENGRIIRIGPSDQVPVPDGAETIDVTGRTIVPGLVNAHGHVGETDGLRTGPDAYTEGNVRRQLGLYARYGVTTVFSLGGDREPGFRIRNEQDTASLERSRLYVAGPVVAAKTPPEARDAVNALADQHVDWVKILVDDNLGSSEKMPVPVYQTVIEVAHRRSLKVAAHMFYLDDAINLLRAGTDMLAHSVRDKEVDATLISLLRQQDVCLCPTLTREVSTFVYADTPDFFSDPFFTRDADPGVVQAMQDPTRQAAMRTSRSAELYRQGLDVALRNLKALSDAGVRIAFGTDTGPVGRFQGYFEHMELELMARAGLTPAQVLLAATRDAAACMGAAGKVGTLEPGAWADLLVLTANPLDDVRNFRTIESVWIAGNRVPGRPDNN